LLKENRNNILLKWQALLDPNHEFLTFLKVLTGDLQTIEEVFKENLLNIKNSSRFLLEIGKDF